MLDKTDLDLSPGTWQQVLDSFYGANAPHCESPEHVLGTGVSDNERRPGLVPESIDLDAFKAFGRGL